MKTIEWNEEQRKAFQDLLREFTALINTKAQEEKQTGRTPKIPKYGSCQNGLNRFLASWGYACKISLGSWDLSYKPSIAFCRQDILGEGFVNGEKPTPKKGFYIWFAYYWRNDFEKFCLCIGRSTEDDEKKELQKCLAYDKIIDPNGDAYYQEIYDDLNPILKTLPTIFYALLTNLIKSPLRVLN